MLQFDDDDGGGGGWRFAATFVHMLG